MSRDLLICSPVALGPPSTPGSTQAVCAECGQAVWVSPTSQRYGAPGPGYIIHCIDCGISRVAKDKTPEFTVLPGQDAACEAAGLSAEDIQKAREILHTAIKRRAGEIGQRVGAIGGYDKPSNTLSVFGYGTYQGHEKPPKELMGEDIPGFTNPRIDLDSGETVWGCECWWGPEEKIKKEIAEAEKDGAIVKTVTVKEWRERDE